MSNSDNPKRFSKAYYAQFERRSYKLEFMDTGEYTNDEYEDCLRELRLINRVMGDVYALKQTLIKEIRKNDLREFSVLDIGAGSGEMLRVLAEKAKKDGRKARLCGLEMHERSAKAILEESKHFPNVSAVRGDAFKLPFVDNSFDFCICSLFTHHFIESKVVEIISEMKRVAKRRIFVIDLHRNPTAYFFYTTFGKLILHNRLTRHDGALSILRSFVPDELRVLGERAELANISVTKHFPSRIVLSGNAR